MHIKSKVIVYYEFLLKRGFQPYQFQVGQVKMPLSNLEKSICFENYEGTILEIELVSKESAKSCRILCRNPFVRSFCFTFRNLVDI